MPPSDANDKTDDEQKFCLSRKRTKAYFLYGEYCDADKRDLCRQIIAVCIRGRYVNRLKASGCVQAGGLLSERVVGT